MLSHHDIIMSECSIPALPRKSTNTEKLLTAPRLENTRVRITWSDKGAAEYERLVTPLLKSLREKWLNSSSIPAMSVLLQMTNFAMSYAASVTNRSVNLGVKPGARKPCTPRTIRTAKQRLNRAHRKWKQSVTHGLDQATTKSLYKKSLKLYKSTVYSDSRLNAIKIKNCSQSSQIIRSAKSTTQNKIEKLNVHDKVYYGDKVPDGVFDAMTSLKSCKYSELVKSPPVAEQLSNYDHISKLCAEKRPLPPISLTTASDLLHTLKKKVKDFYSITALHYLNAGKEGLTHFQELLNAVLEEVENATIEELNVAHGIIPYKGHKKDRNSVRSYRTISTCPILSKALDLYIRDIYQEQWNDCQAPTQYQGSGSSHDLASLLVTEVVQHSLHVSNQLVYLLALDAQSAFDRCLREILVCELFKAGMKDDALKLIDNRLKSRSTVYEWDKHLCGPAPDQTGFEQGAIYSSDFYKLYNNEQLRTALASNLGVNLSSLVISAIGQAADVILCANDLDCLKLLVTLTENYCSKYRVKLVAEKNKLLGFSTNKKKYLLDHAKLVNPVTINNLPVSFATEVEHVGVLRNTSGNMPHIMKRITEHKSGLCYVLSAGLARGRHGNPAASLRVHDLYGAPKLFSALATLVLTSQELSVLDTHYQKTIMNLQRLYEKTPQCFVFLMAGCLPGEAVLHIKQLTLFMMICHLPQDPLNTHARHVLMFSKNSSQSWFLKIRALCLQYRLDHPLRLLDTPPLKPQFKKQVKQNIIAY